VRLHRVLPVLALLAACASDDSSAPDAGPSDATTADVPDVSTRDAGADAPQDASIDAPIDAPPDAPPAAYNDFTVTSYWSSFDATTGVDSNLQSFAGGTFDGRYVYFVPNEAPNLALRYDTQGAFSSAASWETFDTESVDINAYGFVGAVFDGRYVDYVPWYSSGSPSATFLRFDTKASFGTKASWSIVAPPVGGFQGGTFDGRYVYVAQRTGTAGNLERLDTTVDGGAWSGFDLYPTSTKLDWLFGGLFDGRYVYVQSTATSTVARYDTKGPFDAGASFESFGVGTDLGAAGLGNGAFDGRYLYFSGTKIARYDTQGDFSSGAAWDAVSATGVAAAGCVLGAFDGRYVYFLGNGSPKITRYDTLGAFTSAWPVFDTTSVGGVTEGFYTAIFDGRYLYLAPNGQGAEHAVILRFDAKSPPSMPPLPAFHGSFF
jgi:hypothetical protein